MARPCAGEFVETANTESCLSRASDWHFGHTAGRDALTIASNGCWQSRQTYSKMGIVSSVRLGTLDSVHRVATRIGIVKPWDTGLPPGTLMMLVLRVLKTQPLHGYAIAQRIRLLSAEELSVEEGSLYPALETAGQRLGDRRVACIGVRPAGARIPHHGQRTRQLDAEVAEARRMASAIGLLLDQLRNGDHRRVDPAAPFSAPAKCDGG